MLALGAGVGKGEVERPVAHIDVASAAAEMLGVKFETAGKVLRELV